MIGWLFVSTHFFLFRPLYSTSVLLILQKLTGGKKQQTEVDEEQQVWTEQYINVHCSAV